MDENSKIRNKICYLQINTAKNIKQTYKIVYSKTKILSYIQIDWTRITKTLSKVTLH